MATIFAIVGCVFVSGFVFLLYIPATTWNSRLAAFGGRVKIPRTYWPWLAGAYNFDISPAESVEVKPENRQSVWVSVKSFWVRFNTPDWKK